MSKTSGSNDGFSNDVRFMVYCYRDRLSVFERLSIKSSGLSISLLSAMELRFSRIKKAMKKPSAPIMLDVANKACLSNTDSVVIMVMPA